MEPLSEKTWNDFPEESAKMVELFEAFNTDPASVRVPEWSVVKPLSDDGPEAARNAFNMERMNFVELPEAPPATGEDSAADASPETPGVLARAEPPCRVFVKHDSITMHLSRVKNGWILHGSESDYVIRTGHELLEALHDDIGLELSQPPSGVNGGARDGLLPPPAPPPGEHPTRLKAKDRGVSTNTSPKRKIQFKHPFCGHTSNMTAGGCQACNKRFCSVCYACGCQQSGTPP